eukprot:CAMPEP_0180294372 /NCGR_PEP_ID=MMETSP0988-20121125/18197_1 /TAXON_ID=697907 /ORGANISM="non described non described, Strain CCMP2293" /LENGTH=45 /DNA_ID= /DNA_START= /DNA_END= /DNA_ORIENTATION=
MASVVRIRVYGLWSYQQLLHFLQGLGPAGLHTWEVVDNVAVWFES